MNIDLAKDRLVTHSITNYLNASYQGKFASLNVLSQTKHESFQDDEIAQVQQTMAKIGAWNAQLYQDECLFSAAWSSPETFDAKHALDLLEKLKPEISGLSTELVRILNLSELPSDGDIKFLLAALTRQAYSKDAYIRGFIEYGSRFGLPQMVTKYEELLPGSSSQLQRVHELLNAFRQSDCLVEKMEPSFFAFLHDAALNSPAVFRTHLHDINLLLSPFKGGGITFPQAEFSRAESDLWQNAGFGPVPAGYWRAYGINPEEARAWTDAKLGEAAAAAEWRNCGFDPQSAAGWAEIGFVPGYAAGWLKAGYSPQQAKEYAERGVFDPPLKPEEGEG